MIKYRNAKWSNLAKRLREQNPWATLKLWTTLNSELPTYTKCSRNKLDISRTKSVNHVPNPCMNRRVCCRLLNVFWNFQVLSPPNSIYSRRGELATRRYTIWAERSIAKNPIRTMREKSLRASVLAEKTISENLKKKKKYVKLLELLSFSLHLLSNIFQ